jgi:WD40 repeat protein
VLRRAFVFAAISTILSASAIRAVPSETLLSLLLISGGPAQRSDFALSPDGETCAVAWSKAENGLFLWQTATRKLQRTLKAPVPIPHDPRTPFHTEMAWLAFSPNGRLLAYATYRSTPPDGAVEGAVQLWDVPGGTLKQTLAGTGPVCFSPDGQLLASGGMDKAVRLWDVQTGQPVRTLPKQELIPDALAFSADGSTLATADRVRSVRLWDVQTGLLKPVEIKLKLRIASSVRFSLYGSLLAAAGLGEVSKPGAVQLLDAQTGQPLQTLTIKGTSVECLGFNRTGTTLAAGTNEGTVTVWDVASGRELRTVNGGVTKGIRAVAITPDGTTLLEWDESSPLRFWDIRSGRKLRELNVRDATIPAPGRRQ